MQPPFFVIGAPRSGTSYLVQVLDRHPEILLTNETRVMTFMHRALTRHSKDRMALMAERQLFLETFRSHVPGIVRDFYRRLGATDEMRWGDKFPHYADAKTDPGLLDDVARLFPRCQFVHITRDGRDVVTSLVDKGWVDLEEACDVWTRHVEASRAIGRKVGPRRYHELRYEDLVADGVAATHRLLEFLGLDPAPEVDDFLREQDEERTPFSGATTPPGAIGRPGWAERLSPDQLTTVETHLAPALAALGYDSPSTV
ncbi:sulfotransferase [Isoptericola hypogeus]|uniref:Sulfotransferase n=1 Tax=Isoptericola hypogeus TaxID=300179 RepID=A0ABP4VQB2_9MICO